MGRVRGVRGSGTVGAEGEAKGLGRGLSGRVHRGRQPGGRGGRGVSRRRPLLQGIRRNKGQGPRKDSSGLFLES